MSVATAGSSADAAAGRSESARSHAANGPGWRGSPEEVVASSRARETWRWAAGTILCVMARVHVMM
jgi:hypothetical protein